MNNNLAVTNYFKKLRKIEIFRSAMQLNYYKCVLSSLNNDTKLRLLFIKRRRRK